MPRTRQKFGYYRISLADTEEARTEAIAVLERQGVSTAFMFGDATENDAGNCQPDLDACLRKLGRGDVLVVASLDRLGPRIDLVRKAVSALIVRGADLSLLDGPCAGTIKAPDMAVVLQSWLIPAEDLERRLRSERNREAAWKGKKQELRKSERRRQRDYAAIERLIGERLRKPTAQERRLASLGYEDFYALNPEELDLLIKLICEKELSRSKASEIMGLPYEAVLRYVDKYGNEQKIASRMRRDAAQGGPERRLRKAVLDGALPPEVLPKDTKLRADLTQSRRRKPKQEP